MAGTVVEAVEPSGNVTLTVDPGSAVPDTAIVPSGFADVAAVGLAGGVASPYVAFDVGEALPAGSVSFAVTGPEPCGVAEVMANWPFAGTIVVPVVPSGNVTFAVDPGSPVPDAVMVPLAFGVMTKLGAAGGVTSV